VQIQMADGKTLKSNVIKAAEQTTLGHKSKYERKYENPELVGVW